MILPQLFMGGGDEETEAAAAASSSYLQQQLLQQPQIYDGTYRHDCGIVAISSCMSEGRWYHAFHGFRLQLDMVLPNRISQVALF
jgi:hypothetical protein